MATIIARFRSVSSGFVRFREKGQPAGVSLQTPLGELAALPQTPCLYLGGLLLKGGRGRGRERRRGKGLEGVPYSITERRVPELIPALCSQPAGDVNHKPGGRLLLLSARPAVTPATLKRAATKVAAW